MGDITSIPGALQTASSAIQRSTTNLRKDADVVAHANGNTVDTREMIGALIDARQQVLYTRAAVRIINASDEMIQSLLDVRA